MKVRESQRVLILTWIGSVAALVIYLLIPWFVGLQRISSGGQLYLGFRVILWFLALIQVSVVLFWSRRALSKESVSRAVRGTAIDPVNYYMGKKVTAIAMAQSVAVYGLALALVGRYFWDQYILTFISTVLVIWQYPSRDSLDELATGA
jgi:hypothetical protein